MTPPRTCPVCGTACAECAGQRVVVLTCTREHAVFWPTGMRPWPTACPLAYALGSCGEPLTERGVMVRSEETA